MPTSSRTAAGSSATANVDIPVRLASLALLASSSYNMPARRRPAWSFPASAWTVRPFLPASGPNHASLDKIERKLRWMSRRRNRYRGARRRHRHFHAPHSRICSRSELSCGIWCAPPPCLPPAQHPCNRNHPTDVACLPALAVCLLMLPARPSVRARPAAVYLITRSTSSWGLRPNVPHPLVMAPPRCSVS